MSDNKVDNKLDFRNVKHSQFGGSQIERAEYSELQSAKRVFNTTPILKDSYTHFTQTLNVNNLPTLVEYWQASDTAVDKLQFSADVAGSKAGTYFTLQEYLTKKTHVFYYVVSGSGSAPGIGDIETPINITNNDPAAVVTLETASVIGTVAEFNVLQRSYTSSYLEISYFQFGETGAVDVGTSGILATRIREGSSFKVGEVCLDYDIDGNIVYGGNTLKGLLYNPYTASFDVERGEVTATVDFSDITGSTPEIYNINMATKNTEYTFDIPVGVNRFKLAIRNHESPYTIGFVSGGAYYSQSYGTEYSDTILDLSAITTIYFTAKKDNMVMEIITWK